MRHVQQQIAPPVETSREALQPSAKRRSAFKAALLAAMVVCGTLIFFLLPVREQLGRLHEIRGSHLIVSMGWAAPLIFTAAAAVLVAIGVPRLLVYPVGGMAFGVWQGLLWSQLGCMLGAYAAFLFARWTGREFILRAWPRLNRYCEFGRRRGIVSVLLSRQLPLPGFFINLLLGLTSLSHVDFLLGTCAGFLPAAVPATLVGSGITVVSAGENKMYAFFAIAAVAALWILASRLMSGFLKKKKAEDACAVLAEENNPERIYGDVPN